MMRYVLAILLFSLKSGAQTPNFQLLDADNSNTVVPTNFVYLHTVAANMASVHNFSVNNTSATTQTVIVKRYIQYLNTVNASDKADAPFSYNQVNFSSISYSAVASAPAGQKIQFNADLYEASIAGPSEVHYKFMDASDTTKVIKIIMKYNVTTGLTHHQQNLGLHVRVFPNPVTSEELINIVSSSKIKFIELTDASGKMIGNWSETEKISTKDLAPGIYTLKIVTEKGIRSEKLIIDP
jgi:hypothetical protein